jgi:adenylate cyclase
MVQERAQRRLAAILAADIAGYSRLMGRDEEGTLARLKTLRQSLVDPKVEQHRGRIVKTTGDGTLVEFASAVDAVRCALEIQRAMADRNAGVADDHRIEFRIGINVGDIISDEGDIYGDGVNVAARLETLATPGAICLSDNVYQHIKGKLTLNLDDLGDQQLKNIAQPVHAYRVHIGEPEAKIMPALPDRPSIAVLPFSVMQGAADDEAFADGLTEDIITALSRIKALFVIARNSSFTYKGRAVDIRQVGRDLGIRYALEGSIRRSGDRLRVTAQLVEATSGNHIWAEKYDRPVSDIFDLQDDLTRSVVASTQAQIDIEEGVRAERTERPDVNVWLLVKRSWGRTYHLTPEALAEARGLAERALELAPESGLAHEVMGVVLVHQVFMRTVGDARATLAQARDAAVKALRLEGSTEYAYWALGMVQFTAREPGQAILSFRQGLEVNPNCALIHASIGNSLALMGRADESIAATELAMRINPRDPSIFFRHQALADAYFVKGDFEKMVEWAAKGIVLKPDYFGCHLRVVSGLGLLGRLNEAQIAIQRYVKDVPDEIRSRVLASGGFVRDEDSARFSEGLEKAGLPR